MISLHPINEKNFKEVTNLSIYPYQQQYVASTTYSLAQCYLYRDNNDVFPFAIIFDNQIIGFILFDEDLDEKNLLIWRLIIDKTEQQKGYGKKVLHYILELLNQIDTYNSLTISCIESNIHMISLLQSLHFKFAKKDDVTQELVFYFPL